MCARQPLTPRSDFTRAFNRLYVCRRFPSTWHQLTLHSGWQGPSAGGPYFRSNALQLPEHKGEGGGRDAHAGRAAPPALV